MEQLWNACLGNGQYKNPILYADYSDPDIVCVGSDFYMISSSFTYLPGVPVLHSKDLVNWELINYCVKKLHFEKYNRPAHGSGTWAPAIRHHNGVFYVFIPMPDEGIFVTTAADPYGEWSELHCIKEARGWIDPCPFWDDDGKAYMAFAYARSRCGIKHRISICEMNPEATQLLSEPKLVFDGELTNPTMEGPKVYKRNGYYYIFAPAGGVPRGWQTVLRSKSIYGPYEYKIVMHQGNTEVNGPHQGGYIELPDGRCYFAHFQDAKAYGRIIHLQPMCWVADWPFIGTEQNGDGIGEPVALWNMPVESEDGKNYFIPTSDDFKTGALGLQWQWQANPDKANYSLTKHPGNLTLFCVKNLKRDENLLWYAPNACTQMLQAPAFEAVAKLTLCDSEDGDLAGIGMIGHTYTYCCLQKCSGTVMLQLWQGNVLNPDGEGETEEKLLYSVPAQSKQVTLKIKVTEGGLYSYSLAWDDESFKNIGSVYKLEKASWTGAKFTLYACNRNNKQSDGYGKFEYVKFFNQF